MLLGLVVLGWLGAEATRATFRALRPIRVRCAWCGRVRVKLNGQACKACIDELANDPRAATGVNPRAAPPDWPEAS